MNSLKSLLKKELIQLYLTPLAWVFHGVFLLLHGVLFSFAHTFTGVPATAEFWGNAAILQVLLIPVLTMKAFSDEYRLGTDQLYYTTPVSRSLVVVTKYIACLLVYGISMVVVLVYPLVYGQFGRIDIPELLVSTFGAFLSGSVYIALGLSISAMSTSSASAAILTSLVLLVNWLLTFLVPFVPLEPGFSLIIFLILGVGTVVSIKINTRGWVPWLSVGVGIGVIIGITYGLRPLWYVGLVQNLLMQISIVIHQQTFVLGIIPLNSVVFFLVLVVVVLQTTILMLERRRWKG